MFWKLQLHYLFVRCVASKPIANSQLDRSELEKDQIWSKHVAEYIKWSQCPKRTCDNKNKSWIQSPSIWSRQNILSRGLEIQPWLVLCLFSIVTCVAWAAQSCPKLIFSFIKQCWWYWCWPLQNGDGEVNIYFLLLKNVGDVNLFRTVMVKFARAEPAALRPLRSTNKSTFWENNWYEYEMKSLFSSNNNEVQIVDCRTKLNVPPPGFHKLVRNIICGFELVTYVNCVPFYHRILNLSFKKENWIENQELNHRPPPGFHKLGLGIFLMRPQFSIELHFQPLHIYPLIRIPTFLDISILFCVVNFV